jgi:hypothetical protein
MAVASRKVDSGSEYHFSVRETLHFFHAPFNFIFVACHGDPSAPACIILSSNSQLALGWGMVIFRFFQSS